MGLTFRPITVALDMAFGCFSARFTLGVSAALLLAGPATVFAEAPPEPLDDLATGAAASRPSATLPAHPAPLPDTVPLYLSFRDSTIPLVLPGFASRPTGLAAAFGTEGTTIPRGQGFSVRLLSRMNREARSFRRENVSEAWGALPQGRDDPFDSVAAARRNAEASRVVTRSLHRALDDELDRLARTSLGLGPSLDFLQGVSLRRLRAGRSDHAAEAIAEHPQSPRTERPEGLRGDLGLRLDAHPALVLRARFRGLHGLIELPARNEPARLSLESPVGAHGRAVLSAGQPHDGLGWTTLTFNFRF